ncbi:MAG: GNAT family N-acetyltransferase [Chthoniobacterales bacterium]
MHVERYEEAAKPAWDDFIGKSKNGTFLFLRDYVEYHRDRFEDHSLVVRHDSGEIAALLPANARDHILTSHGGLTYGGFVTDEKMKLPAMLEVFERTLTFLSENGFRRLIYKCIPHIYHRAAAEEDGYALFLCEAQLLRRGALTVVSRDRPLPMQERRRRGARKAQKNGVTVRQSEELAIYWQILEERLMEAYGTRPVHSLAEMQLLQSRFPNNIKLFAAYRQEEMLAGVLIYESENVAHAQYIAANQQSRDLGALDLLFEELLTNHYRSKNYFDFGTSDEQGGWKLNRGLIDQKEGYGARVVVQDHYDIDLAAWTPGRLTGALT